MLYTANRRFFTALLLPAMISTSAAADCCSGGLLGRATLERLGLTRAWFTQVALDPAYGEVSQWALAHDELFVATTVGTIQALDVNSGRTLWTTHVGNHEYPTLGPTVSQRYVAAINGSTVYLLNRDDGRVALEQPVDGAPGAAPVIAGDYLYTPLINGRVVGYELHQEDTTIPWHYQSFGRAMVTPLATAEGLMWTTDDGHLYATGGTQPGIRFRLETPASFSASPQLGGDVVYAISSWGELYALEVAGGTQKWRYATGFPAHREPVVIKDEIYVTTDEPALHCVDAATGEARWHTRGVSRFVAATAEHVYGLDRVGGLYVMNRKSGARLARVVTADQLTAVANDQSDRLILITPSGLIQCLHELGDDQPTYFDEEAGAEEEPAAPDAEAAQAPVEEPTPADEDVEEPEDATGAEDLMEADEPTDEFGEFGEEGTPEEDAAPDDENPFDIFGEEDPF